MLAPSDRVERATWLAAASAGLVLVHVLIDQHIGLWGPTSDSMSHLQAANLGARGVLFAWWMLVVVWVQDPGRKGAPLALFLLVFIEGFLSHGLVAIGACLPPCSGAFPYQGFAHAANLLVGGWASWETFGLWRARPQPSGRWMAGGTVAIIAVSSLISAYLALRVMGL